MATPIVAIVGRPNVGKSTLFNRIIRRREAIVDAVAGVTRDRHYAATDWCGREFLLVDTGGYMIHYQNDIDKGIRDHVDEAIIEADVIIFLTDVQTGVADIDMEVGKKLLRSKKPTILVTNKVDSKNTESDTVPFMKLGFGEPFPVSALHGKRVGDLLDKLAEHFPEHSEIKHDDDTISIAILGKPNVGKSSLLNAIYGKEKMLVTDIPGTTRDAVDSLVKRDGQVYKLIDTAGLRRKTKVHEDIEYYSTLRALRSLDRCQIVLVVVDAQEGIQSQDLKIIEMAIEAQKGILIALNKWDLIEKNDKTIIEFEQMARDKLKSADYINVITISALTKQRVFKVLDICKKLYNEWRKKIDTSTLNRVIQKIIEMNRPPSFRGKLISIKYVTQTKFAPPVFTFFTNYPKGIPDNYRRYLLNQIRESFGFEGVPVSLYFKRK